jgi:hypothetical protein
MLKKVVLATFVAVSFGGAILAFAKPASAQEQVSFEYSSLAVEYTQQSDAGGGDGTTCFWFACW